jgi:hypothetical protein
MRGALQVLGLGLGLLLAGCASQQGRLGLPPEPVPVAAREGLSLPLPLFYDEVQVRAFVTDAAGQRREVGNAECRLETAGYTAAFRTPGRVVVPVYWTGSPPLDVTCRAGEATGAARRSLAWRTAGAYRPWGWYGDPYRPYGRGSGVSIGIGIGNPGWGWGGWGGWGDPWWPERAAPFYPNIEVDLR